MACKVEKLEKNMAKLTIEATAEEFEAACEKAYQQNRGKLSIPGFRKGKAPRKMLEQMYGKGVFYEDAANEIIPDAYEKAYDEAGLDIVSRPEVDVVQMEAGKPFIFTATVATKPEVTLGEYKGLEVEVTPVEVTEEEITAEVDRAREQNARQLTVEDRPIAEGDIAKIDYEGFEGGKPFAGGKGEGYDLAIGSHSFIDGFEEQLIGKKAGDELEVKVTFPEEYHAKELAGKPAVFQVKIHEVHCKELPEANDEFASEVSEFETLAEYKDDIKKKITERKEARAKAEKEDKVIEKIIANSTMEIPDPMVDTQVHQMADEFAQNVQSQGLTLQQYFQFTGMDSAKFMENMKPQALRRIQTRLVLETIAKEENLTASEEEVNTEIEKMAKQYQMEVEKLTQLITDKVKEDLKQDIAVQKAVDLVAEAAKVVPASK